MVTVAQVLNSARSGARPDSHTPATVTAVAGSTATLTLPSGYTTTALLPAAVDASDGDTVLLLTAATGNFVLAIL